LSKKRSETSRKVELPETDDLTQIKGIGHAVEHRLHGDGIYTFAQLAAFLPADIAAKLTGLSGMTAQRISREEWIGQARRLAASSKLTEPQEYMESAPAPSVISERELTVAIPEEPTAVTTELAAPADAKVAQIAPPFRAVTGTPRLHPIETISTDAHIPQNCFPYDQPFNLHLTLDLSDVRTPGNTQFSYRVSIYSKSLEGHPRRVVGEISGILTSNEKITVVIEGIVLPKGTYRLKAFVILYPIMTEPTQHTGLVASKVSDLLLIF
jgi:hypothetical protein